LQKARNIQFFGGKTHPRKLDVKHIEKFLSHLATKGNVAASTQRHALNALVFLYRGVLNQPLAGKMAQVCSKRKPSHPTVLTQEEVQQMLQMII
jgi:site-specific recombinase XerD